MFIADSASGNLNPDVNIKLFELLNPPYAIAFAVSNLSFPANLCDILIFSRFTADCPPKTIADLFLYSLGTLIPS